MGFYPQMGVGAVREPSLPRQPPHTTHCPYRVPPDPYNVLTQISSSVPKTAELARRDAGLDVARNAGRHRGDEAFDQTVPVNLLDPSIVARRIDYSPQHGPVLDEDLGTSP